MVFMDVLRCGFNRREDTSSTQQSASTSEMATEPTQPKDVTLGPMIDAPIVSSIQPLALTMTTENADMVVHPEVLNGRGSSDRTVMGVSPIGPDQPDQDECEVTQGVRGSSSRTGSPHPIVQIHPLLLSLQVTPAGSKR